MNKEIFFSFSVLSRLYEILVSTIKQFQLMSLEAALGLLLTNQISKATT